LATVHGFTLSDLLIDAGECAASLNRPSLTRLLAMVDAGEVSTVVIAKLDRLTRSVGDLAELLERFDRKDVALMSVSESLDTRSAAGRLVINVMVSVGQWEREAIGERTRDAMKHKKASGQRVGTIEYGYQLADCGKLLEPCESEQRTIQRVRAMRTDGRSFQSIADTLNESGSRTRIGSLWCRQYACNVAQRTGIAA
jgi:site-specific DNA recombinase